MIAREIMTENPACCTPIDGLQIVAKMMVDNDCGCIPVVEDKITNVQVGAITDRDIVCRAVALNKNPLDLTAADVMTSEIVAVTPDTSLEDCCNLMEDKQIRRISVVDESGALCGIIAQADIANKADDRKTAEVVQEVSKAAAQSGQ